jgi:hypothetical protein
MEVNVKIGATSLELRITDDRTLSEGMLIEGGNQYDTGQVEKRSLLLAE